MRSQTTRPKIEEQIEQSEDLLGLSRSFSFNISAPLLEKDQKIHIGLKREIESLLALINKQSTSNTIPASIEKAIIHKECSKLTKNKILRNRQNEETMHCEYCGGTSGGSLSYLYPPTKLYTHGDAIPLYFNYVYHSMGILILCSIHGLFYFSQLAEIFCGPDAQGGEVDCGLLYTDFFVQDSTDLFLFWETLSRPLYDIGVIIFTVGVVLLELFFSWRRREIMRKTSVSLSAANYTVMVTNIDEKDLDADIENYVRFGVIKHLGFGESLEIVKINRTSCSIKADKNANVLKELKGKLEALKLFKRELSGAKKEEEAEEFEDDIDSDANFMLIEQEIVKLETKIEKVKENSGKITLIEKIWSAGKSSKNTVAFVTISNPDHVAKLLKKKTRVLCCLFRLRCFCRKGYKLLEPPKPLDIKWDNIGYQTASRHILMLLILILNGACLVVMHAGFKYLLTAKILLKEFSKLFGRDFLLSSLSVILWVIFKVYKLLFDFLLKSSLQLSPYLSRSQLQASLSFRNGIFKGTYFFALCNSGWQYSQNIRNPETKTEYLRSLAGVIFNYLVFSQLIISPLKRFLSVSRIKVFFKTRKMVKRDEIRRERKNGRKSGYEGLRLTKEDLMTQKELNQLFELPEWPIAIYYSSILTNLLIGSFSGMFTPGITLGCLAISILSSLIDKWIIFYHHKEYRGKTKNLNKYISGLNVAVIKCFSLLIVFQYFFTNVYCDLKKCKRSVLSSFALLLAFGVVLFPFAIIERVFFWLFSCLFDWERYFKEGLGRTGLPSYGKVEAYLVNDYDRQNPRTARRAIADWRAKFQNENNHVTE